ncbi:hypothetical protein HMPREF1142_0348 [Peptostreptococcaceae bacterium AS15]|nr:hypothetical protein HMPREF1142_0348 [Peptostreptococcaceae bacterium AS15]
MECKYQAEVDGLRVQYSITNYENEDELLKNDNFLEKLSTVYSEIDNLTNHADGYDYALAVSSGIVSGLIDVFIVGEWDFVRGKNKANISVNNKITEFAKKQPDYIRYCNFSLENSGGQRIKPKDPDRLETAVQFLEWKFPLPGDAPWLQTGYDKEGNIIENKKISPASHHLDDLSHHPTIVGLIACIISQYTKVGTYVNSDNEVIKIPFIVDENGMIEGKTPVAKVGAGIINWCFNVAKHRYGHLMSDIGGSNSNAGSGMGLPGSIVSTLKELSCLPCFNDKEFSKKLANAYKNGIGTNKGQVNLGIFNALFEGADSKVDFRTEKAIKHEIGRQVIPVAINEVVVRSFYFVRHFIIEMKEKKYIELIDFKKIIPLNNRTIVRMISIASATFTAIDIADATIRATAKSLGNPVEFGRNFILRVNFVGIGRFTLAIGVDVFMGVRKGRLELAVACGEIAKTALEEKILIEETIKINKYTDIKIEKMKEISDNISNLKF